MSFRVPLASGLLTGKLTKETVFDGSDHRRFNRHGEAFDMGETFAGVDYETGLAVVDELRSLVPTGATLAQMALRWILMSDAGSASGSGPGVDPMPCGPRRTGRSRARAISSSSTSSSSTRSMSANSRPSS